jgi:phage terminase large subunit
VRAGCEIQDTPDLFLSVPDSERHTIVADNNDQIITYMRRHGFPKMMAAVKGVGSVDAGLKFLQGLDLIVHPRCKVLIHELARYRYKVDPRSRRILPDPDEKAFHPDVIHALRYALEGVRRLDGKHRRVEVVQPAPATNFWGKR